MNLCNYSSTLTDRCGHPFRRSGAHIADGKNTGAARLQRQPRRIAGQYEPLVVQDDASIEPTSVGIGAGKQK
jgi:hypothetical protein